MTKVLKMLGSYVAGMMLSATAMAGESSNSFPTGLQLGVGLSATSGLNGFIGYANKNFDSFWWKRLGVRFDFAATKPIRSQVNSVVDKYIGDEDIEIGDELKISTPKLKAKHVAAMIDIYPFGNTWFLGGWRLTGGYYMGNIEADSLITSTATPGDEFEFEIGGNQYKYVGAMQGHAKINWKYSGPYAGTGFDLGLFYGIKIFVDAGVVFTSKAAELKLDVPTDGLYQSNDGGANWFQVNTPELEEALETAKRKELDDAQKEINKIKYYPIVKVGFMYRF